MFYKYASLPRFLFKVPITLVCEINLVITMIRFQKITLNLNHRGKKSYRAHLELHWLRGRDFIPRDLGQRFLVLAAQQNNQGSYKATLKPDSNPRDWFNGAGIGSCIGICSKALPRTLTCSLG